MNRQDEVFLVGPGSMEDLLLLGLAAAAVFLFFQMQTTSAPASPQAPGFPANPAPWPVSPLRVSVPPTTTCPAGQVLTGTGYGTFTCVPPGTTVN